MKIKADNNGKIRFDVGPAAADLINKRLTAAELTKVYNADDIPAGTCPGCGFVGRLGIAYFGAGQTIRVCESSCWDRNFSAVLGPLCDPGPATPPGHVLNESYSDIYGGRMLCRFCGSLPGTCRGYCGRRFPAVQIDIAGEIEQLSFAAGRMSAVDLKAADVVDIWTGPVRSPGLCDAAKHVVRSTWRQLANSLDDLSGVVK